MNQLIQNVNTDNQSVKVEVIKELRVLGYTDDTTMIDPDVEQIPVWLITFADEFKARADMELKISKTYFHYVCRQNKVVTL